MYECKPCFGRLDYIIKIKLNTELENVEGMHCEC